MSSSFAVASQQEVLTKPYLAEECWPQDPEVPMFGGHRFRKDLSKAAAIHREMERLIEERAPWLVPDPFLTDPFYIIQQFFKNKYKKASADTIVDKSFRDLAFGGDSNLDMIGIVI
jgi:hypothetical protein